MIKRKSAAGPAQLILPHSIATQRATRRAILRGCGGMLVSACLGAPAFPRRLGRRPEKPTASPISGASIYQDLITYYNLGDHRTATKGDLRTSDWIAAELRKAGLAVGFESFLVSQFFVSKTDLLIDNRVIASFPLWPPRSTGPNPLEAPLTVFQHDHSRGVAGSVAVVTFPFDPRASLLPVHCDTIEAAARAGARAVIAITQGPTGEIIAMNTPPDQRPWPVPVLLAPGRNQREILDAASRGAPASFLLDGRSDPATARNVVGTARTGKRTIVVSTPQSGWFRCAGERGPGIALFLGLARWANKHLPDAGLVFVSTSGHEIGQIGMARFLREKAPSPGGAGVWVHLGAGIATWKWQQSESGIRKLHEVDDNRLLMCSRELEPLLSPVFAELPGLTPHTDRAVGEMQLLLDNKYRAFAIAAAHRYHHTPADNPETTAPELLEPVAEALVNALLAIQDRDS